MSIHVHELIPLKMYNNNNKLIIPLNQKNNKKGSVVFLLTPNLRSSVNIINSETIINRNWFKSYYLEKSINVIINENYVDGFVRESDEFIDRLNTLLEDKLPTKERNKLSEKEFGIPSKRKYPLNDEEHVRSAIRMFNYVDQEDEKTLANNIIKKIKKYNMTDIEIGDNNRFSNYYKVVKEGNFKTSYDDYIVYSTDELSKIRNGLKSCNNMIKDDDHYELFSKFDGDSSVIYLGKVYDNRTQVGFGVATRERNNTILYVYLSEDSDLDNEDRFLIFQALINNFRNVQYQNNKKSMYQNEYAEVYILNSNKKIIEDLSISYRSFIKQRKSNTDPMMDVDLEDRFSIDIGIDESCYKIHGDINQEYMTELGLRSKDSMLIFDDIFNENTSQQNAQLKRILYNERLRNQKDVINIYNQVKSSCPIINNTKIDLKMYKGLNLFIDTAYYNSSFFKNNTFINDRAIGLYLSMLSRLFNNKNIDKDVYNKRSVFINVNDWYKECPQLLDYQETTNPISTIIRLIRTNHIDDLKNTFKNMDIVFFGNKNYFKINFESFDEKNLPKFMNNINTIISNTVITDDDIVKDTPDAIVTDIVDRLEQSQKIKLYGLTGTKTKDKQEEPKKEEKPKDDKEAEKVITDRKKEELIDNIKTAAESSTSVDDAINKLDNDKYVSELIQDISNQENNELKVSVARNNRMNTMRTNFSNSTVNNEKVSDLINASEDIGDKNELPITKLKVNSINQDQWDNLQYINFNSVYDVDEDIMAILNFFSTRSIPVGILDVDVQDTSTSEDYIDTWTVKCEDISGTRFSLKFDIPKFFNNRFMRLRGNDKTINAQLMNLPILKTEKDVCQITSNYNKIFFRIYGSSLGKSNVVTDKTIKALKKYDGKAITYKLGSNALDSLKYDLPIDYIDFAKEYSSISYKDTTFYFSQDEIRKKYEKIIDLSKGIPIAYKSSDKSIIYYSHDFFLSNTIAERLYEDPKFKELFDEAKPGTKYSYSKASIMSTTIPVIVILAYCEGLTKSLDKAHIKYSITDKKPSKNDFNHVYQDIIKFNDAYLTYDLTYESSLLMNGLKECNTEDYSIKDINTKAMWIEMLDLFGGRLKSDGIDNFYDLEFDPITIRTCKAYNIPYDFCEALIYANNLLVDSKYNKHVDITGNRLRSKELIAGYAYKALSSSYASYRIMNKKTGKGTMTIKQSAVIDAILTDNTTSDASTINDLCYAEATNTISFKGLSGMNAERSYSLDKRTYDESMNGLLAMSTGFAGTVGETRQGTINMNIQGKRGYIKDTAGNTEIMNDVNSLSIAEALTPLSTTHDDPFREAMSFTQRTKHDMRVAGGDPLLITNGMDDALVNFTPDYFSVVAKDNGKVVEKDDEHIVVAYNNGEYEYVDLRNKVYKNSDGGFYTSIKLKAYDKLGSTVKAGDCIAYDPLSYTVDSGYDDNPTYNQGTIAKVAIITTDDGFEDSCVVNDYISDALSSNVVTLVPVTLSKNTNVFNLVKVGQSIQEGDSLLVIQNAFEDNDVNVLLKNLVDDEETVTSLGRIPIKSHNTGKIEDIKIYRTCELDELSDSLRKIVTDYEKKESKVVNNIAKYDKEKAKRYTNNYKLDNTGKLKGIDVDGGVLIEIYVNYKDDFSVGDKLIFLGAQKGVAKEVLTKDNNPTSSYRPEEPIDAIASMISFDKRMITAPLQYLLAYKGLIELDRQVKDIMGIKQECTIHHKEFKNQ